LENTDKLAVTLEWMRRNGVKSYTEHPSGGFSLELVDDVLTPALPSVEEPEFDEREEDLVFYDQKRPRIQKIPSRAAK
jgi:hypothetical protein